MLNIRNARKAKKISQATVAELLGVTQATFSGWETGKYEIDNNSLIKLSDILNTTTDYLLGKTDISTPNTKVLTFDDFTYAIYNETKDLTEEDKAALLTMAKVLKKKIYGNEKCTDKIVELDNSDRINKDKLENEKLVAYSGKTKETQPPIDEKTTL